MADAVMATDAGVWRACAATLLVLFAIVGLPTAAQVGDFDGDGTADVLLRDADGRWQSHGFRDLHVVAGGPVTAPLARRTEWQWAAGGDFNGNGRYDVLLRHEDGSWFFYPMNGARVGQGRGRAALARGREWRPVGVADLNRDGRDDVLLRRDDGQWAYYAMNGKNRIAAESGWAGLPRDPDWRLAGLGDFDGDGRGDVLLRHLRGAWRLYSMDGRNPVGEHPGEPLFTRDPAWRVAGTGDFDGDGTQDILLRNPRGSWRYQTVAAGGEVGGGHLPRMPRALEWRLAGIGDLDGDGSDNILLRHADGRWSAAQVPAGGEGGRRPASVGLPLDLAWLLPQRPVHFADAALRDAAAEALDVGDDGWITARELARLTSLEVEAAVADLSGLNSAHALTSLVLPAGNVDDLMPLAGLAKLTRLDAPENRIVDLAALAGMTRLTHVALQGNRIESIEPLARLAALRQLQLQHNAIADISPLAGLTELASLLLYQNRIADVSPLRGLHALVWLALDDNDIDDLTPLAGLTGLRTLWASGNRLHDITPLSGLTALEDLDLSDNEVADIAGLAGLTALKGLRLAANDITDLSALAGLVAIKSLGLRDNRIADVSSLAGLVALEELRLESNDVTDISPLAGLDRLRLLSLADNDIVDISALINLDVLEELNLARNFIADVTPLAGLVALAMLDLRYNAVADITPLSALTELRTLRIGYNRIADLSPIAGLAMGEGDVLDVRLNPLDDGAAGLLARLAARGVDVASGGPSFERIHDDSVVVIRVEEDIATDELDFEAVSWTFLRHLEDAFDFLVMVPNIDSFYEIEDLPYDYGGVFVRVANDVRGIGVGPYYVREFGSAGTLKGVVHLVDSTHVYSLAAHEVLHNWANQAVPTVHGAHWGFSSANGTLGGFDSAELVELGGGRYAAGVFGTGSQQNTRGIEIPYSPIELYLAGYVPPEEVPDLWVAEDGAWAVDEDGEDVLTPDGTRVFTASDVRTYSIEDIIARNGERIPDTGQAQWHFRGATILVTDSAHPATSEQLERVARFTTWFSLPGDDGVEKTVNFWEATGGRGTFTMDGLTSLLRPAPAEPTGLPASFGTSQSVNGRPITDPIP